MGKYITVPVVKATAASDNIVEGTVEGKCPDCKGTMLGKYSNIKDITYCQCSEDRELLKEIQQICTNYDWLDRHDLLMLIGLIENKIK